MTAGSVLALHCAGRCEGLWFAESDPTPRGGRRRCAECLGDLNPGRPETEGGPGAVPPAVALVVEAYRRYARGDVQEALALGHPDVALRAFYEPAASREGREAIRRVFEEQGDPRTRWRAVDLTFREVGEYVLVAGRLETVSALGSPLDFPIAWLFTTRDGLIASMTGYPSARDALEAARPEP